VAKVNLVVGTPCFGGLLTATYASALLELHRLAPTMDMAINTAFVSGDALITRARSLVVAAFMDQPLATHLLFIDADIGFKPEQVARLLAFDAEVAAAMYPAKQLDWTNFERYRSRGEPIDEAGLIYVGTPSAVAERRIRDGFVSADYAGTGFMLIKRSAIERLFKAFPELRFSTIDSNLKTSKTDQNLYALFDCIIDPGTGKYLSEDYSFCRRWRQIGGELWLDLRSQLTHVGPASFHGDTTTRFAGLAKG